MRFLDFRFAALIIASISVIFSLRAAAADKNPAVGENFYGVEIADNRVWIVGYYGTILHSHDRGRTWELQPSPTQRALFNIRFVTPLKGWIGGSFGTALATVDGGKTWRAQPLDTVEHLFASYWLDENHGWMAGSRGLTLRTEDGGRSWSRLTLPGDFTFNGLAFVDKLRGWLAGEFGVIFHTRDGGKTWIKQKSPAEISFSSGASQSLFSLLFTDPSVGYAFGLDGLVLKTVDGVHWEIVRRRDNSGGAEATNHIFAAAVSRERISAVGERGTLLQNESKGDVWRSAALKIPRLSLNAIAFGKDGLGVVVGNRGLALRTDDSGKSWRRLKVELDAGQTNRRRAP